MYITALKRSLLYFFHHRFFSFCSRSLFATLSDSMVLIFYAYWIFNWKLSSPKKKMLTSISLTSEIKSFFYSSSTHLSLLTHILSIINAIQCLWTLLNSLSRRKGKGVRETNAINFGPFKWNSLLTPRRWLEVVSERERESVTTQKKEKLHFEKMEARGASSIVIVFLMRPMSCTRGAVWIHWVSSRALTNHELLFATSFIRVFFFTSSKTSSLPLM